jgi:hypothetical protein
LTTSGTSTKGFRVLPIIGGWSGILIVDELGRIIWYYNHTDDDSVSVQARLTTDGQYLVFNSPCHLSLDSECGSLIWVSLDGSEKTIVSIDSIGHDFTQLSDGTICSIVNDTRVVDGFEIYGDRLVEIDIDGNTHELWNAWDSLEIPSVGEDHDWTHANAINTNEEESAYYVGLTFLSTIIKVDALSGEILWRLGGEDSDFVFLEGSERFTIHHNFELRDNVLTLFSNGQGMDDPSRIVQYELDEDAMTIHETWRYVADPPLFAYALGDVATIEEGTLHVTFSTAGYVEQVEGDDVVWTLGASFPHAFGYSNFYTSLYPE